MDVRNKDIADIDAVFVARSRNGDVAAFEVLVARHQKRMLNIAFRMLGGDYEEACDAVQEAFLSAYRAIGKFRGEARFSTWLYGIVVNHVRNRLKQRERRSRHERSYTDDPAELNNRAILKEPLCCGESVLDQLEKKEIEAKVQECLGSLDGEQREVIVLRDMQGFSYEEIGSMLNLPSGTVKSRLFRARCVLKDYLISALGDLR